MKALSLLVLFGVSTAMGAVGGGTLPANALRFQFVELGEPFSTYPCTHEADPTNPYDWNVVCKTPEKESPFVAHVALTFYPSAQGTSSHELLYWVIDRLGPSEIRSNSVTLWFYHSTQENTSKRIDASLGIRNDTAYLKLTIDPTQ